MLERSCCDGKAFGTLSSVERIIDLRNPQDPRLAQTLDAMEQRIAERWRIRDLAILVGLSPSRFAHLFREAIGISPARYLHQVRLERARCLLESTTLPVSEVMRLVGCRDAS